MPFEKNYRSQSIQKTNIEADKGKEFLNYLLEIHRWSRPTRIKLKELCKKRINQKVCDYEQPKKGG